MRRRPDRSNAEAPDFRDEAVDAGIGLEKVLDQAGRTILLLCAIQSFRDAVGIKKQSSAGRQRACVLWV